MSDDDVFDWTDDFDKRLEVMHKAAARSDTYAPECEEAVRVYERMRTAKSIASALFESDATQATVVAIFSELCAEYRSGQGSRQPDFA
ncbi:MAG: hypothetical protein REI09_05325 [Candidatus Dactylopiibacterium sp.]|nr:hypothetical protein [Candidatus Dactylopiibacterium sp.]